MRAEVKRKEFMQEQQQFLQKDKERVKYIKERNEERKML